MLSRPETPLLTINVGLIPKIDLQNVESVLWTLFSRYTESAENGPRLANLSWRLWSKKYLCPGGQNTVDELKKTILAIAEEKVLKHPFSALVVQKLVTNPNPITPAPASVPTVIETKSTTPESSSDESSRGTTSDSVSSMSAQSATSVVRGFSSSHTSSHYRSIPLLNAPPSIPKSNLASNSCARRRKKHTVFALGGSSPSGDDSSGRTHSSAERKKISSAFTIGSSLGEDKSSRKEIKHRSLLPETLHHPLVNNKQTSFREEVATRTIHEDRVIDDDPFETDEEDEIDESAIDDDNDSSEWGDSIGESGKSSIDEKTFFQHVDSLPNLTSRESLITTMLQQNDCTAALATAASKSTPAMHRSRTSPPQEPSLAASPDSDDSTPLMMKKGQNSGQEIPRSTAQPIIMTITNAMPHQAALSPKTTRRNMLQTELTASLRRHLLWERQQKNQTATAVLKQRHTAHDVAMLKQYSEKVHLGTDDKDNHGSWNQHFRGTGDYYSNGW